MFNQKHFVGERIKAARNAKGITQRDLGLLVGLDQAFISRIENGLSTPTANQLLNIAKSLDISVDYLFPKHNATVDLSIDSIELALLYQRLQPSQRNSIKQLITTMLNPVDTTNHVR
ncbi:MAG: helix-turn-helix transcriptional regulator [Candidatus Thiodiazotropha sp.]